MREGPATFVDDLPALDAIIASEQTHYGWRGLTAQGEVFEIKGRGGHRARVPDEGGLLVMRGGRAIGRRAITNTATIGIDEYLERYNSAIELFRANKTISALQVIDPLVRRAPTSGARMNRAMMLLSAGHWREGFAEYEWCERAPPFQRPEVKALLDAGIPQWRGENIRGQRLLLLHDHGYGDTIQMLRYVPVLQALGADGVMMVPQALPRLCAHLGEVVSVIVPADCFCGFLMLGF